LAVLAFSNLGKAEDVFFADGITAELGSRLSGLSGLALMSPSSAKAYKGSGQTPRQFGQSLGADYVLSGTVQWSSIRILTLRVFNWLTFSTVSANTTKH
jgi:TolB-like protein